MNGEKLFNIYCNDPEQRSKVEKHHLLRMNEEDEKFYEDQKGTPIGFCSN